MTLDIKYDLLRSIVVVSPSICKQGLTYSSLVEAPDSMENFNFIKRYLLSNTRIRHISEIIYTPFEWALPSKCLSLNTQDTSLGIYAATKYLNISPGQGSIDTSIPHFLVYGVEDNITYTFSRASGSFESAQIHLHKERPVMVTDSLEKALILQENLSTLVDKVRDFYFNNFFSKGFFCNKNIDVLDETARVLLVNFPKGIFSRDSVEGEVWLNINRSELPWIHQQDFSVPLEVGVKQIPFLPFNSSKEF